LVDIKIIGYFLYFLNIHYVHNWVFSEPSTFEGTQQTFSQMKKVHKSVW